MPRSGENDCIVADWLNLYRPLCKEGRPTFEIPLTAERLHT
jgi:hypothetical protein